MVKRGIYDRIVAGVVPVGSGVSIEVVSHAASIATDSDYVAISYAESGGYAYYIAAPASVLASNPSFMTPLAAALPSHPNHQGDGVYSLKLPGSTAVVVKEGGSFEFMNQQPDLMARYLVSLQLPVYEVENVEAWPLVPSVRQESRDLWSAELLLAKISVWTAVLALCVAIGSSAMSGAYVIEVAQSRETQVADLIATATKPQPMFERLVSLQKIAGVVAKSGGWITNYELKAGKETWKAELPEWVTKDYMDELGAGIFAEPVKGENRILVQKK